MDMTKDIERATHVKPHYHEYQGILHKCYHKTRLGWKTWVIAGLLATMSFPVEHMIWEHVPPFSTVTEKLNLLGDKH